MAHDSFGTQLTIEWLIGCFIVFVIIGVKELLRADCYECDGRGWMYLDEFLENEGEELVGETPPRYFLRQVGESFEIGICPACDGKQR